MRLVLTLMCATLLPAQPDCASPEPAVMSVNDVRRHCQSSPLSKTVTPSDKSWSLDVSSAGQLTPGQAEAYAHVTVTRKNGQHYNPPCEHDVVLITP